LGGAAAQHASEVELAAIAEDFVIENSGTLEDLGNQTQLLIRKLKENPRGMVTRH
jgi:dephospho-CoA kinase